MELHEVVEVADVVSHVMDGFAVVGVVALPDPARLKEAGRRVVAEQWAVQATGHAWSDGSAQGSYLMLLPGWSW